MSFRRLAALAGILFVVMLILNAILLGAPPAPDEAVVEVGEYISENENVHKLGLLLGVAAGVPFVLFLAGLLLPIYQSDRERGEGWSIAVFAGAVLIAASAAVGEAIQGALFLRSGADLDVPVVRALWDAQAIAFTGIGAGVAAIGLFVAIPTLRYGLRAAWYGWFSLAVAALGGLMTIGMVTARDKGILGIVGFLAFLAWTLITSWLMYRESEASSVAAAVGS